MATIKDDSFKTDVITALARIEAKIEDYSKIKDNASDALNQSKNNTEEINEIKEKIKYISRTIASAIITGAIGLVFVYIKMGLNV